MYKLKELVQRSTAFVAAVGLLSGVGSTALPALVSADELNPLTERSLTLSSSSPGFHYLDGSGNTTYAPPGSGNNGQKTGETFTFKNSTDSTSRTIKAFTFQYCTTSAGYCTAPGDNPFVPDDDGAGPHVDHREGDDDDSSDLSIHYASSPVQGTDYTVEYYELDDDGAGPHVDHWQSNTGWTISASNVEDALDPDDETSQNNFITLVNTGGGLTIPAETQIRIVFKASANNYITNPGSGAFFVKINDYDHASTFDNTTRIDGGVTVANVMNDSIQIQTKVLETMSFSVGTENPDTVAAPGNNHGTCDSISENDPLQLGNPNAEYSLETATAYEVKSYWRLSSNSSGGATVYYSGNSLTNTVGDDVDPIGTTAAISHPGTEQFGLAIDSTAETLDSYMQDQINDDALEVPALQYPHRAPHLTPLIASDSDDGVTEYGSGAGTINGGSPNTALFAFDPDSLTSPVMVAAENTDIVDCATGKMRYIANIAATTPAGVYTSRINYIAAPQY